MPSYAEGSRASTPPEQNHRPPGSDPPNGKSRTTKPKLLGDLESARWALRTARTREPVPDDTARRFTPDWADGALLAEDSGPEGIEQWLKTLRVRLRTDLPRY